MSAQRPQARLSFASRGERHSSREKHVADESPADEAKAHGRKTLEGVGEVHLADKDEIRFKDAFRLQHELKLSVC